MKLSKKGEYALRSLINLGIAAEMKRKLVQVSELAENEQLPVKFLEQILQALQGGRDRGQPAREVRRLPPWPGRRTKIFIGEVVRLIDGPLAPIGCVSQTAYEPCTCPDEAHCGLRMLMLDVRNAIADILDRYTLADVVEITLRKMRRDSISLPFSAGGRRSRPVRVPARIARQQLAGSGDAAAGAGTSPSEGVLHHILGEYSI